MSIGTWLRARRLRNLLLQRAMVQAAIDCDARITRTTGNIYPICEERNTRELARLNFLIAELSEPRVAEAA